MLRGCRTGGHESFLLVSTGNVQASDDMPLRVCGHIHCVMTRVVWVETFSVLLAEPAGLMSRSVDWCKAIFDDIL